MKCVGGSDRQHGSEAVAERGVMRSSLLAPVNHTHIRILYGLRPSQDSTLALVAVIQAINDTHTHQCNCGLRIKP